MGEAGLRGDFEAMIKRMHLKVVEGLGGRDRALATLRRQPEGMKKQSKAGDFVRRPNCSRFRTMRVSRGSFPPRHEEAALRGFATAHQTGVIFGARVGGRGGLGIRGSGSRHHPGEPAQAARAGARGDRCGEIARTLFRDRGI